MHPCPNHGEGYFKSEISGTGLEEARKRMIRVCAETMGEGLTTPATKHGEVPVGMLYLSCILVL